ncbi:MAG: hypothetical protein AB1715_14070 [Acidobacteriota bacterium]
MLKMILTVLPLILLGAGCAATPVANKPPAAEESVLCAAAPTTTDIGSLYFPIAPEYSHLRGLGMILTAADCGEGRLTEVGRSQDYNLVGGKFKLRIAPSADFRAALESLNFRCAGSGPAEACLTWTIGDTKVEIRDLLKLKPFIGEIESEDCSYCG